MLKPISRRRWMGRMGAAGAGLLAPLHGDSADLRIAGQPVEIRISAISPHTVRIAALPIHGAAGVPDDGALVQPSWGSAATRFREARARTIKAGGPRVDFTPDSLTFTIRNVRGEKVQALRIDAASGALCFETGSAPLVGLGAGGPQFDRRGDVDAMRSGQGGYHLGTHGGRVPVQFLIGTAGWALFVHQPLGRVDLSGAEGRLQAADPQKALPLDVFVIAAKAPPVILSEYARITGLPHMPPLWSFGYHQSHRTLGTPEEILGEAALFRDKKLPCDAMIYLGTDFCPNGWNTHNGEFNWNARAFPDPAKAIGELHGRHFKIVLHTVLEGRTMTGRVSDPCTAAPLASGRTADNRWPPARQVSCYWPVHKPLFDLGVDGWWPDQGDGLDAESRLARNRMYYEGSLLYRPGERVFALHRNGYAGMQRYAFLWSGDIQSRWETLKTHVAVGINTGLSGIPYWGTDIGGFIPTKELTAELYVRWFQFAAFCPSFRAHGRTWKLRLPWGWNTGDPGPVETPNAVPDPSELHNAEVEPICRKYLELRYRLMPYLYSAVRESATTGMPLIRALWLHYPDDPAAVSRGDQYLWGRDLLVAPVVEKGAASRTLYLPRGGWYDFWTGDRLEGGRELTRRVDLATTPLYVRAGAILPLGPVKQYSEEKIDAPLEIAIHPGADGATLLYEDDGRTFKYRGGEWMGIRMTWHDLRRVLALRLEPGSRMLAPLERSMVVKAGDASRTVTFRGRALEVRL